MKFITFSGVDGSGKSTQLALLREKLERENWNVAYFHAVEFSLASRFKKQVTANSQQKKEKAQAVIKASFPTILLRKIFLIIDLIRFRFLLDRLKRENCDYLLSDRYFFDSFINIFYLSGNDSKFKIQNSKLLVKPDKAFYFDASPENIMSRENPPEQGIEYLRTKQELFKQKITDWDMIVIDANRDKDTIFQEVLIKI